MDLRSLEARIVAGESSIEPLLASALAAQLTADALFQLAEIAQIGGHGQIARRALEKAVLADPQHAAACAALRLLTEELGDSPADGGETSDATEPSPRLVARQRVIGDEDHPDFLPELEDEPPNRHLIDPRPADVARFLHAFAGREDTYARQWCDENRRAGYSPQHGALTPELVRAHLAGSVTLGVYPIRLDGTVVFVAFDLDIRKAARERAEGDREQIQRLRQLVRGEANRLVGRLQDLGVEVLLEESGYKGWHVWVFFASPLDAETAHRFGQIVLRKLPPEHGDIVLEAFPKQSRLATGQLGNLIKLPLGVHQVTGRRAFFFVGEHPQESDPFAPLRDVRRADAAMLDRAIDALIELPEPPPPQQTSDDMGRSARKVDAVPGRQRPAATERSLHEDPEVRNTLAGCAVLRTLVDRALALHHLSHDERVVLIHSLGALQGGVDAVNYVFSRCPGVPAHDHLQRAHRGHPISCARVRQRIPVVTAALPCHCDFSHVPEAYPSPVLHARSAVGADQGLLATELAATGTDGVAKPSAAHVPPPTIANANGSLPADEPLPAQATSVDAKPVPISSTESDPIDPSRAPLLDGLAEALLRMPGQRMSVPGGTWRLQRVGDRSVVVFTSHRGER